MTAQALGTTTKFASTYESCVVEAMQGNSEPLERLEGFFDQIAGREAASSRGAGLSMFHISPRQLPQQTRSEAEGSPRLTVRRGASLASVELGKVKGTAKSFDRSGTQIKGFSKGSRRRLLRLVASIRRNQLSTFATLTYPDEFARDPKEYKRHLDNIFKRILRKYPNAVIIWRMEAQTRKSGKNMGEIAPHFHLLIWNVPSDEMRKLLPLAWYEVVGSGDERHLRAGTSVEPVRSSNGVMYYTSKYIAKADNYILPGWGRYWGVVNRDMLLEIQGEIEVIDIDDYTAKTVLRYMRHKASERYKKNKKTGRTEYAGRRKIPKWGKKFTLICNADFWADVVTKIQKP